MTPHYRPAMADISSGLLAWDMWGRLGWNENKRRYRRTVIGPFWSTLSLAIFVVVLGLVWSRLWGQDSKQYMPFLTSGMVVWLLLASVISEGCNAFIHVEALIKQLRVSYTLLACAVVWRNVIVFFHNMLIFVLVAVYAGLPVTWTTLLVVPGMLLFCLNAVWIVMLLGMACVRYRDIQQLVTSLLQVAMFVTPVLWSPARLGPDMQIFVQLNLLFHYIEVVRAPLLGRVPAAETWYVVIGTAIVGWAVVFYLYSCFRRRIPYWI
jgi:homopolymeric O-antigen transport system permease protein